MQPGATARTGERLAIGTRTRLLVGASNTHGKPIFADLCALPMEYISEALTRPDRYHRPGNSQAAYDSSAPQPHRRTAAPFQFSAALESLDQAFAV